MEKKRRRSQKKDTLTTKIIGELPQYTIAEIVSQITKIVKGKNLDLLCKEANINKVCLTQILKYPDFFSFEMYSIASIILKKSIFELTRILPEEHEVAFRGKPSDKNIDDISFIINLFEEIILNRRLATRKE